MATISRLSRQHSQMSVGGPEAVDLTHEQKVHPKVENLNNATLIKPEELAALVKKLSLE
jgi:hypothetical protein